MNEQPTLSRTWKRPEVHVVFARLSMDSADPIVAVVDSESEVDTLRRFFSRNHPEVEITWNNYEILGEGEPGETIHLATEFSFLNPVVLGAYASFRDAYARVLKEIEGGRDSSFVRVQTFWMGDLVNGEPWCEDPDSE